ncbi:hypothetical protein C9940_03280 [Pseudidiomarina aestuarii]|uniref:Prepilin-type cleavage/methylation domain-containing protein n=1 Tax=Pseudidiomarina aestuarii TaxID=624146 RepID=A0A2T4CXH9_9GAMM|nr:hypothetical protein C9940_03280 [Pseudidiomarina aestuarii]PTB88856.1 hypothetical protein C9928_05335 [Pseudidiomarina aestuarii]
MKSSVQQSGFLIAEVVIAVAVLSLFATTMLLALQWHYHFVVQRPMIQAQDNPVIVAWQQRLLRQSRAMEILQGADDEN